MAVIRFAEHSVVLEDGQSVLEGLTASGIAVPYSCRAGICQTCMMRVTRGIPTAASQEGLKESLKLQNYFLPCACHPEEDLEVALPDRGQTALAAVVRGLEKLNEDILHVALECAEPLDYRPGQFINLYRDETRVRSYSIASVPRLDRHIHLHVRRIPDGLVSGWIHSELRPGQSVAIQGPSGDCFYVPGNPEQALLLIGTGSGLAPLYGIIRDALSQGHRGPICLYHGSRDRSGLYLLDELKALSAEFPNFEHHPCLSGPSVPSGFAAGRAHEVAYREIPKLRDWRIFLCGHPDMVKQAKKKAFLAGASMKDIYADAFTLSGSAAA